MDLLSRCGGGRRRGAAARRAGRRPSRRSGRRAGRGRSRARSGRRRRARSSAIFSVPDVTASAARPRPKTTAAARSVAAAALPPEPATVASSVGASAVTSAAPPIPISAPRTPPSRPWSTDSPVTWRTTVRPGQPSAFSVPSSRIRLVTLESVRSVAIRKAATSATIVSAVPSLPDRFLASLSEPPTRSARSEAVVTEAPLIVALIAFSTAATSSVESARTWRLLTRPTRSLSRCSCASLT